MQSTIFFMVAIMAFTRALQLKSGPQDLSASSSPSKLNNKRYATREFTLFLSPSEIKSLSQTSESTNKEAEEEAQTVKQNAQYILQAYNQPDLSEWQNQQSLAKQSQVESEDTFSAKSFLQEPSPVFENQKDLFNPFSFYQEQKSAEQEEQNFRNNDKKELKWIQYKPVTKSQEQSLHDDLQQHWNRLLEHNRGQLKALLSGKNEKQISKESNVKKESNVQFQLVQNDENSSEIGKQIEFTLNNQAIEFGKENSRAEEQANFQVSPFLIQREVKVTKHLPVPVIKKVPVNVPTPVLVPVPEPYEVKIPHPYPVPYEIVKHIPVPVLRKY